MFNGFYKNRRVFVTGHTGFKGSWLCEWLLSIGAEVHGYALDPQPHEVLFDQLNLSSRLATDHRADIRDPDTLFAALKAADPQVVLHLAAQPLVRLSYEIPVETFSTNVMGTAHLLEAVRKNAKPCSVVCVTTDKCYQNREWLHAYREEDPMGGHDPYSASKGAAEIVIASYRDSYFSPPPSETPSSETPTIGLASARAGNVIGGGDWAQDRIIPDCIRAVRRGEPIPVRNKIATRPWQHVLEPLSGYLHLASSLASTSSSSLSGTPASETPKHLSSAFNFGPALTSNRTVAELVRELLVHTGGEWSDASDPNALHEASKLNLATDKAFHLLQWQPVWTFEETISHTAAWYLHEAAGKDPAAFTRSQIMSYQSAAASKSIPWALPAGH